MTANDDGSTSRGQRWRYGVLSGSRLIIPHYAGHAKDGQESLDAVHPSGARGEFLIPRQMMNPGRVAARERAHRLHALPRGDGYELGLGLTVLAKRLNTQRLLDEGLISTS